MNKIPYIKVKSLPLFIIALILVIIGGYYWTRWSTKQIDSRIREEIRAQTEEIANALNPGIIKDLTFTASDSGTIEFELIRKELIAYGKIMKQRGIYSMALRNGKIFFGPETYNPGDPLASTPGELYEQPSAEDFEIFTKAKSVVMGPYEDEYGNFISGLAPVLDPSSGKVLMVIGVDVLADEWQKEINKGRWLPVTGTIITLLIIIAAFFLKVRRNRLSPDKHGHYRYIESYLVAILGTFLSVVVSLISLEREQQDQIALFRLHAANYEGKIHNGFNKIQQDFSLLSDYFASSQYVSRDEFHSFINPIVSNQQAFAYLWAPCVMSEKRKEFEDAERKEGIRNFEIHITNPDGATQPSLVRPFYYPVQYAEPPLQHKWLPGFDLNSIGAYTDYLQVSSHLNLVSSANPESQVIFGHRQPVLIAFEPVRSKFGNLQDSGFTVLVIGMDSWLKYILRSNKEEKPSVAIDLVDLTNESGPFLVASLGEDDSAYSPGFVSVDFHKEKLFNEITPLFHFGRTFAIIIHANQTYLLEHPGGVWWLQGFFLLTLTIIISLFIRFLQNRQITLDALVHQKTSELEIAMNKAEEGNRLKSALLLNLSHELRTPIQGILGFGEILTEQLKDPDQKKMVNHIVLLGQKLLVTFSSMLQLSRLEAEKSQPDLQICDLGNLARESITKFRRQAAVKKITIKEDIGADVMLRTDQEMFSDILFFLLDNAVKFTETGYIWVILHQTASEGLRTITLAVRDTGIGIKAEQLQYIFEAFRQGSEGIGRTHTGNGMGLTLCKRFVTLLGGRIGVESTAGTGSTFTITFTTSEEIEVITTPKQEEVAPAIKPEPIVETKQPEEYKPHVLVVEDNPANAELLVQYLNRQFYVDVAYTGKLALKYAWQNKYDLILMDINLGAEMDGIQATKEIRSMDNYEVTPIIAVTGYSTDTEKKQILDEGLTDFLSKPFTKNELLKMISKWIQNTVLPKVHEPEG